MWESLLELSTTSIQLLESNSLVGGCSEDAGKVMAIETVYS